ncbi:MAG: methyltransferase domain-containing protein [Proteobacteria bacterium]|nr:methyltransferase domain-containing protein [Pseudomonadota bacterium]
MPQGYLKGKERSQLLVKIIKKYAKQNSKIIEIGCNVGRNLNYLFLAGFKNLNGIEISEEAVKLLKESYPEMYGEVKIYNTAVENVIKKFDDESFNVVFSMAVLEHIHVNSEWIFSEMVRATKDLLVTIEDERGISWGRFPRNYKKIFESLGMKQIEEIRCEKIEGLGADFFARVFKKHI